MYLIDRIINKLELALVHPMERLFVHRYRINFFVLEKENQKIYKKTLYVTVGHGFKPGYHWWRYALTNGLSLIDFTSRGTNPVAPPDHSLV